MPRFDPGRPKPFTAFRDEQQELPAQQLREDQRQTQRIPLTPSLAQRIPETATWTPEILKTNFNPDNFNSNNFNKNNINNPNNFNSNNNFESDRALAPAQRFSEAPVQRFSEASAQRFSEAPAQRFSPAPSQGFSVFTDLFKGLSSEPSPRFSKSVGQGANTHRRGVPNHRFQPPQQQLHQQQHQQQRFQPPAPRFQPQQQQSLQPSFQQLQQGFLQQPQLEAGFTPLGESQGGQRGPLEQRGPQGLSHQGRASTNFVSQSSPSFSFSSQL